MPDRTDCLFVGFILGALCTGLIIGWVNTPNAGEYREQAIQHGFAQHNPKTGEWEWLVPASQPAIEGATNAK